MKIHKCTDLCRDIIETKSTIWDTKKTHKTHTYVLVLLSRDHFFNCDRRFIRNIPMPRAKIYNTIFNKFNKFNIVDSDKYHKILSSSRATNCHDSRATCHIAGCSHLAKSMSWSCHISGCNNCIRHIENGFSPYFIF